MDPKFTGKGMGVRRVTKTKSKKNNMRDKYGEVEGPPQPPDHLVRRPEGNYPQETHEPVEADPYDIHISRVPHNRTPETWVIASISLPAVKGLPRPHG